MKERLKDIISKLRDKCDYLEIRIEEIEQTKILFTGPQMEEASRGMEKGGFVRALYKGGWGEVSFNDLDQIEHFAETAVKQAQIVGSSESILAPVPVVEDEVRLKLINDPRKIPFEDKIALMKQYNDMILNYDPRIKSSYCLYNETLTLKTFANSEGTYIYQERMEMTGGVQAMASQGDDRQVGVVSFGSTNDFNVALGLEEKLKAACQNAIDLLSASKPKAGTYTVILDPILTGVFVHEAFGHLSEGDNVYEDPKLYELMKLGTEMGSPIVNIYDTGTVEGIRGHMVYDDEGVKTEKTYLIKEGKLVGRLHSRETAGKLGEKPTGNARGMDYRFAPICRMRATAIEGGDSTLEEMIQDVDLGIIAYSSRGGQTNGEMFTFSSIYAYMIRDGKIAEMVRDVNLTGNVFTTLKNIDKIGKDPSFNDGAGGCGKSGQNSLPVSMGGPYIRIRNVVVGGEA